MKHNEAKPAPPLGKETVLPWGNSPLGALAVREWTGKFTGKRTVSYRLRLPRLMGFPHSSAETFLEALRDRWTRFLIRESEKEGEEVLFGGLDFYWEGEELIVTVSCSPFGRRVYRPVLRLTLDAEGRLLALKPFSHRQRASH